MQDKKLYEVSLKNGYIQTKVWGDAGADVFEVSTAEVLALREANHINALLCDVRELKQDKISMTTQTRGIGTLWRIRTFDKVAFLMDDSPVADMLHTALDVTHFNQKFQTFDDEAQAIAWLQAESE